MQNETLRPYCFTNKNIDTPKIFSQGKLLEEVSFQVDTIQGTSSTNMAAEIHALREEINALQIQNANQDKLSVYKHPHQTAQPNSLRKCYNWGNPYPHANDCPARNQICHICGKRNHFAKVCCSTRISPCQRRPLNQLEQHEVFADTPPPPPPYTREQYRYTVVLLR